MARRTVIEIVGDEAGRILSSYHSRMKESESEYESAGGTMVGRWLRSIVDDVLKLAKPKPMFDGDRALCPLCGGGSQSPYATGFAFPEACADICLGNTTRTNARSWPSRVGWLLITPSAAWITSKAHRTTIRTKRGVRNSRPCVWMYRES